MANRKHKAYRLFSANISDFHFLSGLRLTFFGKESERVKEEVVHEEAEEMLIYGLSV